MNDYPNDVKETLTSLIMEMASSPALFVKNPETDFTRKRKLPFETVVHNLGLYSTARYNLAGCI